MTVVSLLMILNIAVNHALFFSFQSDSLISLLPTVLQHQITQNPLSTVEITSLPGAPSLPIQTEETDLVGPTTTELESFKELIQFDHVYFKPQPKGKTNSSGQIVTNVTGKLNNVPCVQKKTENGRKGVKNVQIIITADSSDKQDVQPNSFSLPNVESQTDIGTVNLEDYESDMLTSLNFDLLEDLENILKADAEGLSCPRDVSSSAQNCDNGHIVDSQGKSRSLKRKAPVEEIEAIVDTLTADELSVSKSLSSDSGYSSDVPSPYSAHDTDSPFSDDSVTSPLNDNMWEESFTELFPDLL